MNKKQKKLSKYNCYLTQSGYTLIFNTQKCSSVVFDNETFKRFKKNKLTKEEEKILEQLDIIVDKDINEIDLFLTKSRINNSNNDSLFFRIYTTLGCNAKCPYCYQKDRNKINMTIKTAEDISSFIVKKSSGYKTVKIEWFGGEPLCNIKVIDLISSRVKNELSSKGINFVSSMVSNGYLFDNQLIIKSFNDWNLRKIQISLDGMGEYYEEIKQFGNVDSFNKVIENISNLADTGVFVNIRLNYSNENIDEICKLLDFLSEKFKNNVNINVYGHRIFDIHKNNDIKISERLDTKFYYKLKEVGFKAEDITNMAPKTTKCMAYSINSLLIYPDGKLYKCPQSVGFEEYNIGSIYLEDFNKSISKWYSPRLPQKCLKCKYLPLCNGGCLFVNLTKHRACEYNNSIIKTKMQKQLLDYLKTLK